LGLSKNIDEEKFAFYRAAELKHGRVSMLAVIGYIVPEITKFGGDIAPGIPFKSIPNGIAAIEAVPTLGWLQMAFLVGYVDYELTTKGTAGPRWAPFTNSNGFKYVACLFESGVHVVCVCGCVRPVCICPTAVPPNAFT